MDFKCFRKYATQKLLISSPHLHNAAVPLEKIILVFSV